MAVETSNYHIHVERERNLLSPAMQALVDQLQLKIQKIIDTSFPQSCEEKVQQVIVEHIDYFNNVQKKEPALGWGKGSSHFHIHETEAKSGEPYGDRIILITFENHYK